MNSFNKFNTNSTLYHIYLYLTQIFYGIIMDYRYGTAYRPWLAAGTVLRTGQADMKESDFINTAWCTSYY